MLLFVEPPVLRRPQRIEQAGRLVFRECGEEGLIGLAHLYIVVCCPILFGRDGCLDGSVPQLEDPPPMRRTVGVIVTLRVWVRRRRGSAGQGPDARMAYSVTPATSRRRPIQGRRGVCPEASSVSRRRNRDPLTPPNWYLTTIYGCRGGRARPQADVGACACVNCRTASAIPSPRISRGCRRPTSSSRSKTSRAALARAPPPADAPASW